MTAQTKVAAKGDIGVGNIQRGVKERVAPSLGHHAACPAGPRFDFGRLGNLVAVTLMAAHAALRGVNRVGNLVRLGAGLDKVEQGGGGKNGRWRQFIWAERRMVGGQRCLGGSRCRLVERGKKGGDNEEG